MHPRYRPVGHAVKVSGDIHSPAEVAIESQFRPEPLAWYYQPPVGGFDSRSRLYRGYDRSHRVRTLRPARPVCLELQCDDLLTLTSIDGATPVMLLAVNERGENDFHSIGLARNPLRALSGHHGPVAVGDQQPGLLQPGLLQIEQWYRSRGGADKFAALSAVAVFDESTVCLLYTSPSPRDS